MNKRLDYIDMAKGIGMVLVLLGHLQGDQFFPLAPFIYPMCVFIFSFHMPMFFIISGILIAIKNEDNRDFNGIAKKRFKGIMVPYYWFSFFYMLVVVKALIEGAIAPQTLYINLWYVLGGYGMNVLWFLPAIFLGELLFFYLKGKCKSDKQFVVIVVISSAIAFVLAYLLANAGNDTDVYKRFRELATVILRPILACGFISVGYYSHKLSENVNILNSFLNKKLTIASRATYIATGLVLLSICFALKGINSGIDFRSMVFRNVFFFMLCALSGSYGLIIMCKGLPRIGLLTYWGVGSLIFMATHNSETVLYYAIQASMYANQYLTRARGYICYAIIVGIILIYTSLMIFVIQRLFPFIIGRSHRKK